MTFNVGDKVTHPRSYNPKAVGVVVKVIGAQGKYKAVCVVEFGDGSNPSTIWQNDLRKASDA